MENHQLICSLTDPKLTIACELPPFDPLILFLLFISKQGVLVCLGCCKNRPPSGQLISHRHIFLTVPQAGKSEVKNPGLLCSLRALFQVHGSHLPFVISHGGGLGEDLWDLF